MTKSTNYIKVLATAAYIIMVVVNALANALPINGLNTGEISDSYPNLFAPAGITFSIWGLIYLLLGAFIILQFRLKIDGQLRNINLYFFASSILNSLWIFAWHYKLIGLTVILMLLLLFSLIKIADITKGLAIDQKTKFWLKVPFGVYFGWITIATIANITAFLVSIGWDGFGLSESFWMLVVLLVGLIIGIWRMRKDSNLTYGIVLIWAYAGILLKHVSVEGFSGRYPEVITVVGICILVLAVWGFGLIYKKKAI